MLSTRSRSVKDQVILITGAASGMGRATAQLFADEGAFVAVTDADGPAAMTVRDEIRAYGGRAEFWELDVRSDEQALHVVADVVRVFGRLDIVVNNAGVVRKAALSADAFEDAWTIVMDVDLAGPMRLARAALPHLIQSGAGRLINISSTEGLSATTENAAYVAAKHGVVGLTRALAVELGQHGITVNCVCPGPINTAMTSPIADDAKAKFAKRRVPLGRYGEPDEVAHAILSLALPASSFISGAVLVVDGGMLAKGT